MDDVTPGRGRAAATTEPIDRAGGCTPETPEPEAARTGGDATGRPNGRRAPGAGGAGAAGDAAAAAPATAKRCGRHGPQAAPTRRTPADGRRRTTAAGARRGAVGRRRRGRATEAELERRQDPEGRHEPRPERPRPSEDRPDAPTSGDGDRGRPPPEAARGAGAAGEAAAEEAPERDRSLDDERPTVARRRRRADGHRGDRARTQRDRRQSEREARPACRGTDVEADDARRAIRASTRRQAALPDAASAPRRAPAGGGPARLGRHAARRERRRQRLGRSIRDPRPKRRRADPPRRPRSRSPPAVPPGDRAPAARRTRSAEAAAGARPPPCPPRITDKLMVITEHGERDQIAVLEEDVLVQHYVTRHGATLDGRQRVPGPRPERAARAWRRRSSTSAAAATACSTPARSTTRPAGRRGPRAAHRAAPEAGQAVMVQVTKDPMGGKGARLTAQPEPRRALPGPRAEPEPPGISRRLPDDARKRLKTMLKR